MKPKEIKKLQKKRQRPLTENEDIIENLENVLLESIEIQQEFEKLKKEN